MKRSNEQVGLSKGKSAPPFLILFLLLQLATVAAEELKVSSTISSITINQQLDFVSSNLPIIIIDTFGEEIVDSPRISAHMGIIDRGRGQRNYLSDPPNDFNGLITIELRGSSTARLPKKQYRFETVDADGENLNVSLLGMPSENDWVLYGPYDDQSMIRTVLSFHLSNQIGRYASRTRFCELVVNQDYRGLYVLLEKLKRDKNRVAIKKMTNQDNSGDKLTGGYIFKLDKKSGENVGSWFSRHGIEYQYHYPAADKITTEQKQYLQNFVNEFENVFVNLPQDASESFFENWIDIDSFVDHFLLNEFCKNVDAYRISTFMFKNRDSIDGRLNAGPLWDMNLTFGLAWFEQDLFVTRGWQVDYDQTHPDDAWLVPFFWENLTHHPCFVEKAIQRWNGLKTSVMSKSYLFDLIDTYRDTLSEAVERNAARWPESTGTTTFIEKLDRIKAWIFYRYEWIDENIGLLADVDDRGGATGPKQFSLLQNYPNPFNTSTRIRFTLAASVPVKLFLYNNEGKKVTTLINRNMGPGTFAVKWDGTDASGATCASGVYYYALEMPKSRLVRKLVLVR